MHEIDLIEVFEGLGFAKDKISHASLKAGDFDMKNEDHGRAPAWHAYVAQKT